MADSNSVILYGPRGEEISTPATRRLSAVQRQQEAVRARFDVAQTNDENRAHWSQSDYLGPNAELNAATRRILRSRARYECANNGYAAGLVRTLANDTIGTGPSIVVTDKRFNKDEINEFESAFWEWCVSVEMGSKLRRMRLAKARDGETFAQIFTNPRSSTAVQFDFQPFEADFVAASTIDNPLASLLDGLIIDDDGNVIAYNILRQHPGEALGASIAGEADLVAAKYILHLFHSDRPGQYRGCPEILSSLPLWAQLRRFTLAVLNCAESAALPSWVIETQQPPSDMQLGDAFDTLQTKRGMGVVLPGGYKMGQMKAEQPTATYGQFKREIVTEAARGCGPGVPYGVAAGDFSSYNYSSGRLDNRGYFKSTRVERSVWEVKACTPLARGWWEEARRIPGLLPDKFRNAFPRHEWRWDGDEHVDPTKEADAAISRISNGLTSIDEEVNRLGSDRDTVWRKNAAALGLTEDEYAKRMADKFFGAQVKSSSQDMPEAPPSNPYNGGASNG